jgi:hypothetical protein
MQPEQQAPTSDEFAKRAFMLENTARQHQLEPKPGDEKLFVTFYMDVRQNDAKSMEAGHPVYDDVPKVRIMVPGDRTTVIDTYVQPEHVARFQRQWEQFKRSEVQMVQGWAIKQWPAIPRSLAEELSHLGVTTVEQLAEMPDVFGSRLMGFQDLKKRAQVALDVAKGEAVAAKYAQESASKDVTIKAMQEQLNDLGAKLQQFMNGAQAQPEAQRVDANRTGNHPGRRP